ncbi:head GIN domain-containing protein [Aestuariibaculum sediminum]|uniref:DUF2807 domain-containing protein n=1 Tax=Aestuariibaculum sediminum TaxID=2770637 RepID=A0A8J6Q6Z3_9FLAO|nr:head GIN domain-containing protein [Aestuariibaculum sediminum]MBD0831260.1 DUF2807 domain-containing protein [Aestuariibaculum sediminum]
MKTLIKLFVFCITTIIYAQAPVETEIGEFNELKVYDLIQVKLVKANENKAVISGKNKNNVVFNNKNGVLKIKMEFEKLFDGDATNVTLYYTSFDTIDVNEGSKVESDDEIKQFEVNLRAQEGGIIKVPINVSVVNTKAVTGGIVETKGTAKEQTVALRTGGVFKGTHLETKYTDVTINAAGEAYVRASEQVDATVRAGGNVYIYGKPTTINETTVIGGKVHRMN